MKPDIDGAASKGSFVRKAALKLCQCSSKPKNLTPDANTKKKAEHRGSAKSNREVKMLSVTALSSSC